VRYEEQRVTSLNSVFHDFSRIIARNSVQHKLRI